MLDRVVFFLRRGPRHVAKRLYVRIFAPTAKCFPMAAPHLTGCGIEIGGPSEIFGKRQLLPVYPIVGSLDGCNFSHSTVWEGKITEGMNYRYGTRFGYQFISEASQLRAADDAYDFVLSSHMLEHSANPIAVLHELRRVLRENGHMLLVLPDGRRTPDRKRPITTIQHLIDDYRNQTGEDDATHLEEALLTSELSPEYPTVETMRSHVKRNFEHRLVHQHVFNEQLAIEMVNYSGFSAIAWETADPCHIVVWARKVV